MSTERDPRIDPVAGDVLRKKYQGRYFESRGYMEREVDEVYQGSDAKWFVVYVGDNVCTPEITLKSWRKWAATAEVVRKGDE